MPTKEELGGLAVRLGGTLRTGDAFSLTLVSTRPSTETTEPQDGTPPRQSDRGGRPPVGRRAGFAALTAVAVAAATFAVIAVSTSGRHGPTSHPRPSTSGAALSTSPTAATPASEALGPAVSPGACELPVEESNGSGSGGRLDLLDTATGYLSVDTASPEPNPPSTASGEMSVYLSALGGWLAVPTGAVASPDLRSLAYVGQPTIPVSDPYLPPAGRLYVVGTSGPARPITPAGEYDVLLGWANEGIVVEQLTVPPPATPNGVSNPGGGPAYAWAATYPVYLVDAVSGAERRTGLDFSLSALSGSAPLVGADAVWYVQGDAPSQTVVRYDLRTGTETTWFSADGSPYDEFGLMAVGIADEPVLWASTQGQDTVDRLILLTAPGAVTVVWSPPSERAAYSTWPITVTADEGWMWISVIREQPAATPGDAAAAPSDASTVARGQAGVHLDGAGPLAPGSSVTLYRWVPGSALQAVATVLVELNGGGIFVMGSCQPS